MIPLLRSVSIYLYPFTGPPAFNADYGTPPAYTQEQPKGYGAYQQPPPGDYQQQPYGGYQQQPYGGYQQQPPPQSGGQAMNTVSTHKLDTFR